jgi:ArsR family transcriptional regulator
MQTDDPKIQELAELFKNFGDATRIRIMYFLRDGERCVNDIAEGLQMTQSAVSHQLKILKTNKLISARREGKAVFYSLADEHVHLILATGMDHVLE